MFSSGALDRQGKRFFVYSVRDVTEQQRQAKQAAALAQAAASVAATDSIDAVLDAIRECALGGTRTRAAEIQAEPQLAIV